MDIRHRAPQIPAAMDGLSGQRGHWRPSTTWYISYAVALMSATLVQSTAIASGIEQRRNSRCRHLVSLNFECGLTALDECSTTRMNYIFLPQYLRSKGVWRAWPPSERPDVLLTPFKLLISICLPSSCSMYILALCMLFHLLHSL